jgi:hypothetical protein
MPFGDGTGPLGAGPGTGWGAGWCRGPRGGRGGHGWRNVYHATGMPGWMRGGWSGARGAYPTAPLGGERDLLERQVEAVEAELRWMRQRLEELGHEDGKSQ